MRFKLLFLILFLSQTTYCQDFQWAIKTDDYSSSETRSLVTDSQGNIYLTGDYGSPGNSRSFIRKLDKNGNLIWEKHSDSYGLDRGKSIILDKNENLIITGLATGSVIDLNPDLNEQFLITNPLNNNTGTYIIKLDRDGKFIFGNFYLGAFADESTLDNEGNIITTGNIEGIDIDFDAGSQVYQLGKSAGIFVLKNNNDGKFIWAKKWVGSGYGFNYPISLTCDNLNNIILTGKYENSISFANKSYNDHNMNFIFKISPTANELWFRKLGETSSGNGSNADKAVKTDALNNIYCTSDYSTNSMELDFNNTSISLTSQSIDCLIFKLNQNGEYIWHNNIYGAERQEAYSMTFDNNNNIYLLTFTNDFTYVNNECNKVNPNGNANYINDNYLLLKFDLNGNFKNFKNLSSGFLVQSDFENNLVFSGYFEGNLDFDPSPKSSFFMNSSGNLYGLKLSPCTSSIPQADNDQYFCAALKPTINDLKPCIEIINWYDSKTSNTPLNRNLYLEDGKTYYAAYFESCPENERLAVTVHLNITVFPMITNSTFCKKDNPKLSDISIIGSNLQWYDIQTGGNILDSSTLLESNTTYYVTQRENIGDCESPRVLVKPSLNGESIITNSPQSFCIQQNSTLENILVTGQNIKWYDSQNNETLLSKTTLLEDGKTYYVTQTTNSCESERIPITINIQNTLAPTGTTNQPFCSAQNPTIAHLEITGTSIKWYDEMTNGNLLYETTNLQDGKTYYASQTENTCESSRFGITVSIVNTPSAPALTGTSEFCKSQNATLSTIQMSGQNIKWFDTSFSASALSNTTLLENNRTYYASQTVGCESDRTPVLVKVYDTALPTGKSSQQFCIDEIAAIENLNITGTNLKWYDVRVNGNILSETTLLQNGIYYATQTVNNCESERFAVTVKIQDTPIPTADSSQKFCIQKNAKISDIDILGQSIKWYESVSSLTNLSESTSLESGTTYFASQTVNTCESDRIPITISILGATTGDCINFIDELPFPKFFTPNNDSHNDYWTIDSAYLAPYTGIKIFDRYGKLIKELAPNTSWDGTYIGNQEPASDYWFVVTRLNGQEYRGHFSLKR